MRKTTLQNVLFFLLWCISLIVWSLIYIPYRAFADVSYSTFDVKPPTLFQRVVIPSFTLVGMNAEVNGMLLLERFWLHTQWLNNKSMNVLRKFLKKYSKKFLPHRECKVWLYTPLGHDFYKQIGGVIPYYNRINTYKIRYEDKTRSRVYMVWSGDIDIMHDNCGDSYTTLDDKPAQCTRNMWAYFGNHDFEILSCK